MQDLTQIPSESGCSMACLTLRLSS